MGNVFPSNKDVHETYDLKGSTFGRITTEQDIIRNPHAVLKDLNWVEKGKKLELGIIKRKVLLSQLHKDVKVSKNATYTIVYTNNEYSRPVVIYAENYGL